MPGIGISPCPPFNNMPGIPGILYDGNTVAWYDYKHSPTVIKDGANRVSSWLNKLNFTEGPELIDQGAWYTAAYWTGIFDPNWSQVGNTLVSDGNNGYARRGLMTINRSYKVTITIVRNAGTLYLTDGTSNFLQLTASGTYVGYINATAVNFNLRSILFNGSVTALSMKEVTGPMLWQLTGANQPLWSASGILFDGLSDYLKTFPFVYNQPEMIYIVLNTVTWINNAGVFDGNASLTMLLRQRLASPQVSIYAGAYSALSLSPVLNTYNIIRILFNGANSTLELNNTGSVVVNPGVLNGSGFTLGAAGGITNFANIEVKEIILRRSADSVANQTVIYNYLKRVNGV